MLVRHYALIIMNKFLNFKIPEERMRSTDHYCKDIKHPLVANIRYLTDDKVWVISFNNEFYVVIAYCPYCGKELPK